jgi:DNA-binding CsgD family transcriptional regulator
VLRAWTEWPNDVRELISRALAARALHQPETTQLSEREQAVLILLPSLLSLDEIAEDLSISVNRVKSHLRAAYQKLGVSSRRAAVVAAHKRELLTTGLYMAHRQSDRSSRSRGWVPRARRRPAARGPGTAPGDRGAQCR